MKRVRVAMTSAALIGFASMPAAAFDGWHLESATTIPSKTAGFDYIAFDGSGNRLFIGHRKEGLQVFDLASNKIVKVIGDTPTSSSNGAVLMPEFDLGISNNEDGTITPFKLSTLEAQEPIKLGEDLDTSHYDPASKRIFVNMAAGKDGSEIIVLEAPSLKQVGAIKVASKKLEHAVPDGRGNLYMASRDLDRIYRIDTRAMKVTAEWPTKGCGQSNSVALDVAGKRLFVACRGNDKLKPSLIVMNTDTGAVSYKAEIGGGNDGLVYDPDSKRIFAANGLNANLNVFEQVNADGYKPVEALGTRPMVKVLAYDGKAKKLYSMTAESSADFSKKINTSVGPFYPNTFIPNTFTILTYAK